jgi:signal transduction histidine kinase
MKRPMPLNQAVHLTIVTAHILTALAVFLLKYTEKNIPLPSIIFFSNTINRTVFYLNFFIPFTVYCITLYAFILFTGFFTRWVCISVCFFAAVLSVYILEDIFIVNIAVYAAFLIGISYSFKMPKNIILAVSSLLLIIMFMYHPSYMGKSPGGTRFNNPPAIEIIPSFFYLVLSIGLTVFIKTMADRFIKDRETIKHLNMTEKKLILFNHKLQELAKRKGEDAVKEDRLRFTRDLHDSSGYAFTNIILVTDAAVSCGTMDTEKSQETFQRIRKLASRGLQDTRDTLHFIRNIREPYLKSVDTVYQLRNIFQEVTGIQVDIEWGNMKHEYGPVINKVISQIIQEAFTNSIRHGKATRILIQFWEFPLELSMTVTDNGIGASTIVKGIGLAGMEERLGSVGGKMDVSLPGEGGFRIGIRIPIVAKINQRKQELWANRS